LTAAATLAPKPKPLVLPNGLRLMQANSATTARMYRAIFGERCYDASGLAVGSGDAVLDVGANVGVATLFFHRLYPEARILAFEPAPLAFAALRQNFSEHSISGTALNVALGRAQSRRRFTYYPQITVMSGFYSDPAEDERRVLDAIEGSGLSRAEAITVLAGRFEHTAIDVEVATISSVVREYDVGRIALVKIDAEGAELEILQGIDDGDWRRIERFVGEIHGEAALGEIRELFGSRGYQFEAVAQTTTGSEGFSLFRAARRVT
jgi:31-O-methyltransferase